jgi:hypothetical protein
MVPVMFSVVFDNGTKLHPKTTVVSGIMQTSGDLMKRFLFLEIKRTQMVQTI